MISVADGGRLSCRRGVALRERDRSGVHQRRGAAARERASQEIEGDPRVRDFNYELCAAGAVRYLVGFGSRSTTCRRWWRRACRRWCGADRFGLIARGLAHARRDPRDVERRPLARDVTNRLTFGAGHPGGPSLRGAGLDRRPAADHLSSTSLASPTTSRPTGGGEGRERAVSDHRTPVAQAHDRGRGRARRPAPAAQRDGRGAHRARDPVRVRRRRAARRARGAAAGRPRAARSDVPRRTPST